MLALIVAIGVVLLGWYYYLRWRFKKVVATKYRDIAPLIKKLEDRENILKGEVEIIARNGTLRHATYRALEAYGRIELFPSNFLTIEKGAESLLITWLEFPTELGEAPHEIELSTTIALDGILNLTYLVFKYRMLKNHWAERYNWMLGVVGPYNPSSKPYDIPARIFSRFNPADTTTPEREARWVHENVQEFRAPFDVT